MSNHAISHGKTLFDIFNMINPNCYQAFIMNAIIENKKELALQYCDELSTALEYYKWDSKSKQSSYTDSLICESNLLKWQKNAIMYIVSNNVNLCKNVINDEIAEENKKCNKSQLFISNQHNNKVTSLQDLYDLIGIHRDNSSYLGD
jgi:hypothetical protein